MDRFIDLIYEFSGFCEPPDACENKESCWTHSWWTNEETDLEQLASVAAKMRQDPSWWDINQFKGDERRCSAPKMNWGLELRSNGFCYWTSCSGELTT